MKLFRTNGTEKLDVLTSELQNILRAITRETDISKQRQETLEAAEAVLNSALADAALGGDTGAVQKAREHVQSARADRDAQVRLLGALRSRLWTSGATAARASVDAHGVLDREKEEALQSFAKEWSQASEVYARVLGRRSRIEKLVGARLRLPDPKPVADSDVRAVLPMHCALAELYQALSGVSRIEPPSSIDTEESALLADFTKSVANLDRCMDGRARQSYELEQTPAA